MTFYIELNSAYRNRKEFPLASEFTARARTAPSSSVADPVSLAAPEITITASGAVLGGTVSTPSLIPAFANITQGFTHSISFPTGSAFRFSQYYVGAVLADGTPAPLARILQWTYSHASGGRDYFLVLTDTSIPVGTSVTILNATDVSDPLAPVIFIPYAYTDVVGKIMYNQTLNEWQTILAFDSVSHTATIGSTSGGWLASHTYTIRRGPPAQAGNSLTTLSSTTATIVPPAPVGSFIYTFSRYFQITQFTPPTTVTVTPEFPVPPATILPYEILSIKESEGYINLTGCLDKGSCFNVQLLSLILPSATLVTGMRPIYYPYFYVELRTAGSQATNRIYSNNPNAWRALFRTTVYEDPDSLTNPFLRLKGDGICQRVRIDPFADLYFRVFLPDGTPFQTVLAETSSPVLPNPAAQISALFSLQN